MNIWSYVYEYPDYTFRLFVAEKNSRWKAKAEVFWKKRTKELTNGAGKDFEIEMGPFRSFLLLIGAMERKFKNNPLMGSHLFHDDFLLNMDLEAVELLKKLKQTGSRLSKVTDSYFDDLKKIYKSLKNMPESSLLSYAKVKYPREEDKQDLILDLQKLERLDYFTAMLSMNHF